MFQAGDSRSQGTEETKLGTFEGKKTSVAKTRSVATTVVGEGDKRSTGCPERLHGESGP